MANDVTITLDDAAVQAAFDRLTKLGRDASPMMAEIAEHLLESTQRRFDSGTDPQGAPWVPLKDGSGRTPLRASGTLRDQIFPSSGPDFAQITATTKYARWHQEGTGPYVILPKGKKALAWKGGKHPVKKVNHPGLPARPFMGMSQSDYVDIRKIAAAYMEDAAEG